MKKTALILGAAGVTGSIVLNKLLNDDRYDLIKLFSRKRIDGLSSKIEQYIGDLLEFETFNCERIEVLQ
jgi:nucleoside-diphosphate-sugar epimerase